MKILVVGIIGLLAGFALAMLPGDGASSTPGANRTTPGGAGSPGNTEPSIESRLLALEEALVAEQGARQMLEEEFFYWLDATSLVPERPDTGSETPGQDSTESPSTRAERRAARRAGNSRERRAERLVAAGFDAATADWILTRESELQMESLRTRYEANRNGETVDFRQQNVALRDQLRQQLGDAEYERYLTANGRSLHVSISSVLDSSPAQSAGLRTGDQIVNYGGARIYNMSDLTQAIIQGAPNERVVVHFLRDGIPMQVVLPRGPVGITGR